MKLISARSPAQDSMPKFADPKLREAVVKLEQAIGKFNDGEPRHLSDLMSKREEVTLLGAAGGHEKGREKIDARFQLISAARKGAQLKNSFEYLSFVETKDMAYIVSIERRVAPTVEQHNVSPAVRSTHIFCKEDGVWKLVHRHSDPLVELKKREEKK